MLHRWLHYEISLLVLAEFDSLALYDAPLVFTLNNLNGYQAFFFIKLSLWGREFKECDTAKYRFNTRESKSTNNNE